MPLPRKGRFMSDNSAMWRNATTNTLALTDRLIKRHHDKMIKTKSGRAFLEEYREMTSAWFDQTRKSNPETYDDCEAVWVDFTRDQFDV